MADFGDFSTIAAAHAADATGEDPPADTFGWFGEQIRLRPHIPSISLGAFFASLDGGQEADAIAETTNLLKQAIDPADWSTFRRLADDNDVGGAQLLDVIMKILEARSGRPTRQPSGSSDGSSGTSPTSTPTSASTAAPLSSSTTEERIAADLGIPVPPESRPDARAALRLVDEAMAETG